MRKTLYITFQTQQRFCLIVVWKDIVTTNISGIHKAYTSVGIPFLLMLSYWLAVRVK